MTYLCQFFTHKREVDMGVSRGQKKEERGSWWNGPEAGWGSLGPTQEQPNENDYTEQQINTPLR